MPLQEDVPWVQCPQTCYTLTTDLGPVGRPFLHSEMPTEIYLLAPLPWMHPNLWGFKEKALQTQPKVQTLLKEITLALGIAVPRRGSLGVFGVRAEWMLSKANPDGYSTVITGDPLSLGQRTP